MCKGGKKKKKKRKLTNTYLTSKRSSLSNESSLKLKKKCLEDHTDNYKQSGFFLLIF